MADHDETVVDATLMTLQLMGHAVRHTLDGTKVSSLVQAKPDLLILDTFGSGIDGCAVCWGIKNDPATKDITVILISADTHAREFAFASGADAYLSKPFEINELIHMIDELIYAA